jgi:hypothetical protein
LANVRYRSAGRAGVDTLGTDVQRRDAVIFL